jgi:hypothetical protein
MYTVRDLSAVCHLTERKRLKSKKSPIQSFRELSPEKLSGCVIEGFKGERYRTIDSPSRREKLLSSTLRLGNQLKFSSFLSQVVAPNLVLISCRLLARRAERPGGEIFSLE